MPRCKKEKKAGNREKRKEAAAAGVPTVPSPSKSTRKKGIGIRKNSPRLLSNREETDGEEAIDEGDWGSEIEEYEDSSVDIDDTLDPEEAPARRIPRLEATKRPPVVTRSGRVVKVGNLEE